MFHVPAKDEFQQAQSRGGHGSSSESSIRVLHVDDEPDFADMASTFLVKERETFEVVTAHSAQDALDYLESGAGAVDCIVSDYQMPGTDGLAFLETVREDDPDLPFILFTGKGSEEVASDAISAGVTDYLQKQSGTSQYAVLANRIENAVVGYRAEQQAVRSFQAMESAREGISLLDDAGYFIYVNNAYASIVGYEKDELIGQHWERLYPDEAVGMMYDEILPNVPIEGRWTGQTEYVRKDGERILVDHGLAYTDDDTMICLIFDVTPEAPPAANDQDSLEYRRLVDALDDIFYVLDSRGDVIFANQRMVEVTGYTPEEMQSQHELEFVAGDDRDAIARAIDQTLARGGSHRTDAHLVTEDGRTVLYDIIHRPVTDAGGTVRSLVGVGRENPG